MSGEVLPAICLRESLSMLYSWRRWRNVASRLRHVEPPIASSSSKSLRTSESLPEKQVLLGEDLRYLTARGRRRDSWSGGGDCSLDMKVDTSRGEVMIDSYSFGG